LAGPCAAQSNECEHVHDFRAQFKFFHPLLGITPPAPNASQVIEIRVSASSFVPPFSTTAVVQDGQINITFRARQTQYPPPEIACGSVLVGPLPAGNYQINLLWLDQFALPTATPGLMGTSSLAVTPDLSMVPAMSDAGLAALGFLLSVVGWFGLRRR
jgi:hypothetical protein